ADLDSRLRGGEQRDAARLTEDQGRAGIPRVEDVLHHHHLRPVPLQLAREPFVERAKPIADRPAFAHRQHAVGEMADARAARVLDDAESAEPRARIDAEDPHECPVPEMRRRTEGAGSQAMRRATRADTGTYPTEETRKQRAARRRPNSGGYPGRDTRPGTL